MQTIYHWQIPQAPTKNTNGNLSSQVWRGSNTTRETPITATFLHSSTNWQSMHTHLYRQHWHIWSFLSAYSWVRFLLPHTHTNILLSAHLLRLRLIIISTSTVIYSLSCNSGLRKVCKVSKAFTYIADYYLPCTQRCMYLKISISSMQYSTITWRTHQRIQEEIFGFNMPTNITHINSHAYEHSSHYIVLYKQVTRHFYKQKYSQENNTCSRFALYSLKTVIAL